MRSNRVVLSAPAKLNLYLQVLGRRPDGYHELDTVMLPLSLADRVTVSRAGGGKIEVRCPGHPELDGENNLAWRAAGLLVEISGKDMGLRIVIKKRIPTAAGLGGGSSDAAAVLLAARELFGRPPSHGKLHEIAVLLGADVPFFLVGESCRAGGTGDRLRPVKLERPAWVVLAQAPFGISTAAVFREYDLRQARAPKKRLTADVRGGNNTPPVSGAGVDPFAAGYRNHLQPAAVSVAPAIGQAVESLERAGAVEARMTGSGPTVFCLCRTEAQAREIASSARLPEGWKARVCRVATTRNGRKAQH